MALASPGRIVLDDGNVIDYDGRPQFSIGNVDLLMSPPLITPGFLFVTTRDQRLERRKVPLDGLQEDAPYPTVGGNVHNSRRAMD